MVSATRILHESDDRKLQWVDRLDRIIEATTKLGVAYMGYKSVKHPLGAIVGLVALKIASSPNDTASVAGAATLAGMGVLAYTPETDVKYPSIFGIVTKEAFGPSLFQLLFP